MDSEASKGTAEDFPISADRLSCLFTNDSIRNKQSLKELETMKGVEGVCQSLKSHPIYGIPGDLDDIQARVNK